MDIDLDQQPAQGLPVQIVANNAGSSGKMSKTAPPAGHAPLKTSAPVKQTGPTRSLRVRPSDPMTYTFAPSTSSPAYKSGHEKEIARIKKQLGEEGINYRREELVKEKEVELKDVVEGHDAAVKEKFHLERFTSILENWDPEYAKNDNPSVFMEYKNNNYNLLNLLPTPSNEAGPSRPAVSSRARQTRRQTHAQEELLAHVVATPVQAETPSVTMSKGKGKAQGEVVANGVKMEQQEEIEDLPRGRLKGKPRGSSSAVPASESSQEVLPDVKGKKRGRQSMPSLEGQLDSIENSETPNVKGKKRARQSMPATSTKVEEQPVEAESSTKGKKRGHPPPVLSAVPRKLRSVQIEEPSASPSPSAETLQTETDPETIEPSPPPTPLPSLAHIPFPPPPFRPKERLYGPRKVWYTLPTHNLVPPQKYEGEIAPIMESYIHIEDTGTQPDMQALHTRALNEAYFKNRVNYLQHHGRLSRLLDDSDSSQGKGSSSKSNNMMKPQILAPRKTDYHDSLISHMIQVRTAMMNEAKMKPVVAKRIARMIQIYWDHILNKGERERIAEEREQKRKMKELVRALKKRWSLAVKIIRAQYREAQKIEQDRLGKEHLQNMLQQSTGLLDAHRDEMMGGGQDDEDDSDEDSDRTDEVSSAEESEEEGPLDEDPDENEATIDHSAAVDEDDVEGQGTSEPEDSSADEDEESDGASEADIRALITDDLEDQQEEDLDLDGALQGPEEGTEDPKTSSRGSIAPMSAMQPTEEMQSHTVSIPLVSTAVVMENGLEQTASAPSTDQDAQVQTPNGNTTDDIHIVEPLSNDDVDLEGRTMMSGATDQTPQPNGHVRSKRVRKSRSVSFMIKTEDPDADDIEYDEPTSDIDNQDIKLDEDMEDSEDDDSEDAGLLADADVPIEELLAKYGYMPGEMQTEESKDLSNGGIVTDKSLTDEALSPSDHTEALIIEGKRQRRVRSVWTPEEKDQALKRPKVQVVEEESDYEMTPSVSASESAEGSEAGDGEPVDPNRLQQPFLLRGTLRPYQHAGLEWLASLYQNNMNGILADEMGLGKTIQTIAVLAHLACDKGVWGQHLIIVPTSVILNWEMEFKKFLPGMKVLTYYGDQKERKKKRIGWHTENAWQVCITSYQIVLADQHIFRRKNWIYMILDEAHNIKNFRSQRWQTLLGFKAQRRLLLTGTPLQNNLMELWSLLYFLMPNGITADATAVVGFANHKDFMEWFSNPMDKAVESGDTMNEEMIETVAKLHTLLRPFILRRLKSEVETQLPGKFEHVVYCRLSKRQRFLYDEFMSRSSTKEALTSGGYLGVVNTLMQLRKVCNHPDLFEVRPVKTSFAMDKSVLTDFEPEDLLIRRKLMQETDDSLAPVTNHEKLSSFFCNSLERLDASNLLPHAVEPVRKGKQPPPPKMDTRSVEGWLKYRQYLEDQKSQARWRSLRDLNRKRCCISPVYGSNLISLLSDFPQPLSPGDLAPRPASAMLNHFVPPAATLVHSYADRARIVAPLLEIFALIPPVAVARDMPSYALPNLPADQPEIVDPCFDTLHQASVKLQIAFPDASLLQYDCGKLQKLSEMLRDLKAGGHRVLIFTQMTRVLDILEMFLSYNGHRYLRLDGSTKIEDRQIITERFNSDARIFCFIASSRSGGVGINLTGADTVFFYDSDWNPSMDRQCMDRAHRIGQTREVHIYRFVSSHTVEENMLKKANQKRLLDKVVIQEGDFTTDFFGKTDWRDIIGPDLVTSTTEEGKDPEEGEDRVEDIEVENEPEAVEAEKSAPRAGEERDFARALAEVEDEEDAAAARIAQGEGEMDLKEFEEGVKKSTQVASAQVKAVATSETRGSSTPMRSETGVADGVDGDVDEDGEEEEDDGIGAVDEYMLRFVEFNWDWFVNW